MTSRYSSILGTSNEFLGLLYYAFIVLSYTALTLYPEWLMPWPVSLTYLLISFAAFVFSVYLLYVQLAKLKEWCTLCIFSSLCSTVIFLAVLGGTLAR